MRLVVFDSSLRTNFYPLSLTRPIFDLTFGTGSLLSRIEEKAATKATDLFVPEYLLNLTQERHPDVIVNRNISDKCLVVNSLISVKPEIWKTLDQAVSENSEVMFFDSTGNLVFGIVNEITPAMFETKVKKVSVRSKKLVSEIEKSALIRFPWKLVEENGQAISEDFASKYSAKQHLEVSCETRGNKFSISKMADIERYVTLDSRTGPIIIEDGVHIQSFSHLTGPCFVGRGSILRSAKVREGSTIGEFCRVAGEMEQSIISSYTNKNHDGYLGHSLVGSWVNLGAMTTTSDLKNTYGEIKVNLNGKEVKTGSVKIGAFIGDMAKTGIGTMINSGKSVGVSSHALGTIASDVPSFTIYSGATRTGAFEMYLDSAIETERRMMSRRGIKISDAYIAMIKTVFGMTKRDRASHRVTKGKFNY